MGRIQVTNLIEIVVGAVVGALVCTWTSRYVLPVVAETMITFVCMKIAGDVVRAILVRGDTHYLEDILGDLAAYTSLALVSAAAIWASRRYLGGNVEPVFPGAVAHAVLTMLPGREQRTRAAGG